MIRKLTLALLAIAAIGSTGLIPTAASAHGFHGFHGFHGGFGFHRFGPTFVVGGGDYDDCLQRRIIDTPRGPRIRLVNVCGY